MNTLRGMVTAVGLIAIVATVWVYGRPLSDKFHLDGQTFDSGQQPSNQASTVSGDEIVDGYKQWTRVNPVPALMHSQVSTLCAAPVTARLERTEQGNPHRDKFITVYVNELGRQAMMEEKTPRFPQGSVIVKEKLTEKNSSAPELLTVMIKRESGYNQESGDWEFMVLDGRGKNFQSRGKLEHCLGCHLMVKETDYVSRSYLPDEVRRRLK